MQPLQNKNNIFDHTCTYSFFSMHVYMKTLIESVRFFSIMDALIVHIILYSRVFLDLEACGEASGAEHALLAVLEVGL